MNARRSMMLAAVLLCVAVGVALAADDGKALFEAKCTMCHAASRALSASKDKTGWTATIEKMKGKGAQVSEGESAAIADYLAGAAGK